MTNSVLLALPDPDGYDAWLRATSEEGLARVRGSVEAFRGLGEEPAEVVLLAWEDINLQLANLSALVSLLSNVHPDESVRDLADSVDQEIQRLSTELSLDRAVFEVLDAVDPSAFDVDASRVLEHTLRDFRRSGVDRDEATRARLQQLGEQLTDLGQRFAKNIRNGVRTVSVPVVRLTGLPEDFVASHPVDADGQVELTTDYPDYMPVRTFAEDRDLRRDLTVAFLSRAWPENQDVLRELLQARDELARLLGYADWPSYDAEVKMVGAGEAIPAFIDKITERARESAERDFAVVLERAQRDHPELTSLSVVDKHYYAELVRCEQHDVDAREVRRYFAFDKVRQGLLDVTADLFGLEYKPVEDVTPWHEDVTVHDVHQDGRLIGRIYLDLHPRAGKYSHAAQFVLVPGAEGRQLPEGVLVCNFSRGLMEHRDVVTLFHEFGHLVHHVVGGHQRWVRLSGVATEWDFVEAPSQMLEEWAWDEQVLARFAADAEGTPIPADLVRRMRAAEEFGKGYEARTQMFYAAISYALHAEVPEDITARMRELQAEYDRFEAVPDTHFEASFGHLGGYTSAYYTYMWSRVIAKDLFSAFDPDDLFQPEVARRYRDRVLAAGGSKDAADLVADFLGRPYSYEAFEAWLAS